MATRLSSEKPLRSIRLEQTEIESLLNWIDEQSSQDSKTAGRLSERFAYRQDACVVRMQQPGAANPIAFLVPTRNLSAGGMSFLHSGFVHKGTKCGIYLISLHGTWAQVNASVLRCRYLDKGIHEVSVRFSQPVEPSDYCSAAMELHVLLVEDDLPTAHMAMHYLHQLRAHVDHVTDGRQAVEKARAFAYDLIMMDVGLPGLDGLSATQELRKQDYEGVIVACTALSQEGDRDRCLAAGCNDYLAKPYGKADIERLMGTALKSPLVSSYHNDAAVAGLIADFVRELPNHWKRIEDSLTHPQPDQLASELRGLRGSAGVIGFGPIAEAAKATEDALTCKLPSDQIAALVKKLINLCRQARGPETMAETPNPAT